MFSDRLTKIDQMPYKTMLGLAAGLVMLCQLVAMVLVVEGQVKKAEARDSSLGSQRLVIAQCNQAGSASARQSCVQQAMAAFNVPHDPEASTQVQALTNSGPLERGEVSTGKAQGFTPAAYTIR